MTWTPDVLEGLARDVASAGIGVYSATDPYSPDDIGIGLGRMPEPCIQAIGITAYGNPNDSPAWAMSQLLVQFRFRGLPDDMRSTLALHDHVFDLFHGGVQRRAYGGCVVDQILRRSSVPMGFDALRRYELADNYALDITTPATTNRT